MQIYNLPLRKTIFFSEKGITPASAGHISNLAKEYYRLHERRLEGMSLTNKSIRLLSGESAQVGSAITEEDFSQIPSLIDKISKAKALIAWLREAIKAREALIQLVKSQEYIQSLEVEPAQDIKKPESPSFIDNDGSLHKLCDNDSTYNEYRDMWWWEEREERDLKWYLSQDERIPYTIAKTVTDSIEEFTSYEGMFYQKVNEMYYIKCNPIVQTYRETSVYRAPSVSKEIIAEVEYNLKQLSSKYAYSADVERIRKETLEREDKIRNEYLLALEEYSRSLNNLARARYLKSIEILQKVRNLRIIVPESLQGIYQEISSLGHG